MNQTEKGKEMMTHDEMIAVIAGHREGRKVQFADHVDSGNELASWRDVEYPHWDFWMCDYRLAPDPPQSVPPGDLTWEEACELHKQGVKLEWCVNPESEFTRWVDVTDDITSSYLCSIRKKYAYRRKPAAAKVALGPGDVRPGDVVRSMTGSAPSWASVLAVSRDEVLLAHLTRGTILMPIRDMRDNLEISRDGGKTWVRCEREA